MNKQRALLLDRDGVINHDTGYIGTPADFAFLPGLFTFLRAARDRGFRIAVLTNQSGVARGKFTVDDYDRVNAAMMAGLRQEKIDIECTLACFEHPEGVVEPYVRESFWRKPNPGMVLDVLHRLSADPARSAFVGDNLRDMQAAQAAGVAHCLWLTPENPIAPAGVTIVRSFDEILNRLSA
jgi:D-glycero-D-manno-heptose 1,7-bisphosphate phosphatase